MADKPATRVAAAASRAATTATNRLSDATGAATTFWTTYRRPILIGVATVIALYAIYYMFFRPAEGFNCPQHYPQGKDPRGYPVGYPGHEGFYVPHDVAAAAAESQNVSAGPKKLILFYAPWCPHCQTLMDNDNAAWPVLRRKHGNRQDLSIEEINCEEKPEIATKYGVGGFPTIVLYQGNKSYTYDGDRTLESLEKFIESPNN